MKTKELELTDEQIEELEPFINSKPDSGNWLIVAQLQVKDRAYRWDRTKIKLGMITGLDAIEATDDINRYIDSERSKSTQMKSIEE